MTSLHKGAGWFVIDGGQGANVADELIQQCGLNQIRLLRDQRFLWEHHLFGSHRVSWQQTPINVASVTEVRVVRVLKLKTLKTVEWSWSLMSLLGVLTKSCQNPEALILCNTEKLESLVTYLTTWGCEKIIIVFQISYKLHTNILLKQSIIFKSKLLFLNLFH